MTPDTIHPAFDHTILNVDDSAAGRYVRSRILQGAGYRVIEAGTGTEALRLAREHKPQLVVLDVNLPDRDGVEVCRRLKTDAATAATMVLLVSAVHVRREDKVAGLEEGADGYLVEPVEPDELLATVKALLRLSDSEQRLALALKATNDALWDWDVARDAVVWNQGIAEAFGWEEAPKALQTAGWWVERVHPEDRQRVADGFHAVMHNPALNHWQDEYRFLKKDGSYAHVFDRGFIIRNEQGAAIRMAGAMQDITERTQAEADLRENEERLRLALEAGRMGAWDVDLSTSATSWDEKEFALLGLDIGSLEPSSEQFYRHVHPDDREEVKRVVHLALNTGRLEHEFRIVHPDGQVRWLAAKGQIIKGERGRPVRMVGVNYDVTDRRQTEAQLRSFAGQLEQLVEERTQELVQSQERLRALATELNLTEQRERKRLATELHDHLAQMLVLGRLKLSQAKHVPGLVPACADLIAQTEGVLDDSLKYTRTLVADLSPPVLHDFGLSAALKWLSEQMKRHDLTVTVIVNLTDEQTRLPEDRAMLLFQSVRELLMNTAKHAQSGEAWVSLEQRNGELHIQVRDEGKGFDRTGAAASLDRATALSSKFGLFSIRERMLALGGRFDLVSSPGRGTTATLTLPLCGEAAGSAQVKRRAASLAEPGGTESLADDQSLNGEESLSASPPVRVLLVDDHAMMRQGLRSVLDSYDDVEVVGEAGDGEEAMVLAERFHPSIVVMDVHMPRKNGIEATAELKGRFPQTIVIGLSVHASGEVQQAMKTAGADTLLTKEAAVDELYYTMQQLLGSKG